MLEKFFSLVPYAGLYLTICGVILIYLLIRGKQFSNQLKTRPRGYCVKGQIVKQCGTRRSCYTCSYFITDIELNAKRKQRKEAAKNGNN